MLSLFVQVRAEAEGAARFLLLRLRPCQRVSPHMWPCLLSVLFPGNKGAISFFFWVGWGGGGGHSLFVFLKDDVSAAMPTISAASDDTL